MPVLALEILLAGTTATSCVDGRDDLTVFAAISLRRPLDEIATAFEEQHADVEIAFNFAGSQFLRFQIEQGAPADAFVSADERQMQLLEEAQLVAGEPVVFAHNRLVVAIPDGNPGHVETIDDLGSPGLRLVWAAETVPLGAYSREALDAVAAVFGADFPSRVRANIVSEEQNAEAVVGKVELGEADAAIIYETDAPRLEAEGATTIPIPDAYQPGIRYLAATVETTGSQELSRAFVQFLLSEEGQRILIEHGFFGVR